jgi:glycosyltransferase involved in cell wall biosynthesis
MGVPRVAFFTDSFHETNGVALTSRQFAAFAKSHYYPFFSVHGGPRTAHWKRCCSETYELANSGLLLHLEHDLAFDLRFRRHYSQLKKALAAFQPDLVHVTGPGHIGILGAFLAHDLKVPMAASWHTNIHEFGAKRLAKMAPWLGSGVLKWSETVSMALAMRFYSLGRLLFAPNVELVDELAKRTGRPVRLMQRGVDSELFSPDKRPMGSRPFTIGYAGRLSAEKNVRMFAALDEVLRRAGAKDYQFLIVGEGSERAWLRQNLTGAILPGLLHGEDLARAYASMDVFVFPSETDTFGNVILEAAASGVPSIVSPHGGPKFLIEPGQSGFIAADLDEWRDGVRRLLENSHLREEMGIAARELALERSWTTVFERVYDDYNHLFPSGVPYHPTMPKTLRTIPVS